MPFSRVGGQKIILGKNKLPIFLIPGILGTGNELSMLAWKLYEASNHQRDIYIFNDSRLLSSDAKMDVSLNEQVQTIAEEIQSFIPDPIGCFPFFIIGYSYGCTLATLAAQHLNAQGEKPYLYLIDGASPLCSKLYFMDKNFSDKTTGFIDDLIPVVNAAATLSELHQYIVKDNINNTQLKNISLLDSETYLEKNILLENITKEFPHEAINIEKLNVLSSEEIIEDLIKTLIPDKNAPDFDEKLYFMYRLQKFIKFMAIIKTNLEHFLNYTPPQNIDLLPSITALITDNTAQKYHNDTAGWKDHAKDIILVKPNMKLNKMHNINILEQAHLDLIKKHDVMNQLASAINKFLKDSVPDEEIENMIKKHKQYNSSDEMLNSDDEAWFSFEEHTGSSSKSSGNSTPTNHPSRGDTGGDTDSSDYGGYKFKLFSARNNSPIPLASEKNSLISSFPS